MQNQKVSPTSAPREPSTELSPQTVRDPSSSQGQHKASQFTTPKCRAPQAKSGNRAKPRPESEQGLGTNRKLQGLKAGSPVITLTWHTCLERKGPFQRGQKGQETTRLPTFPIWLSPPPFQSHQGSSGQPKPRTRFRRTQNKYISSMVQSIHFKN